MPLRAQRVLPGSVANDQKDFRILAINVRSIRSECQMEQFEQSLEKVNFDVCGLSETRRNGREVTELGSGFVLINSGADPTAVGSFEHAGVGFYLRKELLKNVSGVRFLSPRIIQLRLKLKGRVLRLTQVYAPHSGYSDSEYDSFLDSLEQSLIRREPVTWDAVIGDFNASVGLRDSSDGHTVGRFGFDIRNSRGQDLVDFCNRNHLKIMNTFFKRSGKSKWTWHSPNNRVQKEIDYILSSYKKCVQNVSVLRRVNVGSDHRVVRATLRLKFRLLRYARQRNLPSMYNKLQLQVTALDNLNMVANYSTLVEALTTAKHRSSVVSERPPRLSSGTMRLLEQRSLMKFCSSSDSHFLLQYSTLNKLIRIQISDDLRRHKNEILKKAIAENSFRLGKRELIYSKRTLFQVYTPTGQVTSSQSDACKVAAEFYGNLYANVLPIPPLENSNETNPILASEIISECKSVRSNRAAGKDKLPSTVIKYCLPFYASQLAEYVNQMFASDEFPPEFIHANTILLFKKGDPFDLGNYRPISLLSAIYKVVTRVLAKRISDQVMRFMPCEQAGFRKTYSTTDHVHAVNMSIEKSSEWSRPLQMCFVDFQKAFDSIEFASIWEAMSYYQIDEGTRRMVQQLYLKGTASVILGDYEEQFEVKRGVRQGDSLSPLLFILTLQHCLDKIEWRDFGVLVGTDRLRYLAYADDIVIVSNSQPQLRVMVEKVATAAAQIGLKINIAKTKWMGTCVTPFNMSLQGVPIEKVERFVYLGQVIQLSRNHTSEISKRISSAWNSYRKVGALLTHRLTDMSLKRKFFHMCILPILLYGCEAWCLTKEAQSKLMRCQRSMERRMLGISLRDHVRHEDIRARTGLKDVCKEAKKRKWKYMEKMQLRREEGRWDQRLMDWTPPYKRPLGRPRLRWTDDFRKHHGLRWRDLILTRQWNPD